MEFLSGQTGTALPPSDLGACHYRKLRLDTRTQFRPFDAAKAGVLNEPTLVRIGQAVVLIRNVKDLVGLGGLEDLVDRVKL